MKAISFSLAFSLFASYAFAPDAAPSTRPSRDVYLRIAGEVENNLQKEILDRFFPMAADEKYGGFHDNYGTDWSAEMETARASSIKAGTRMGRRPAGARPTCGRRVITRLVQCL